MWEAKATKAAALLLGAEQAGAPLLKMQCAGGTVEVTGAALVQVKESSMLSSQTLKFVGAKGIQEPSEYEAPTGQKLRSYLEASFAAGAPERAVLKTALTQTGEEALEVNPVT